MHSKSERRLNRLQRLNRLSQQAMKLARKKIRRPKDLRPAEYKKAEQFLKKAEKFAAQIRLGKKDGEDALRVIDTMLKHDDFMKQLAAMKLLLHKHHRLIPLDLG